MDTPPNIAALPGQANRVVLPVEAGNAATVTVRMESHPCAFWRVKTWVVPTGMDTPPKIAALPGQANRVVLPVEAVRGSTFTVRIESHPCQFWRVKTWVAPTGMDTPPKIAALPGQANRVVLPVEVGNAATVMARIESQPIQLVRVK